MRIYLCTMFFIRILTLCNTKYKYYCFYFSFRTWYPSFITFLWQALSAIGHHFDCTILLFQKWIKKSCLLSGNFISVYTINRTLHGCLGIRILSFRAESVSHSFASLTCKRNLQHPKIKFLSPRGHVISSIYATAVTDWLKIISLLGMKRYLNKEFRTNFAKHDKMTWVLFSWI